MAKKVFFLPWEQNDRLEELIEGSGAANIADEGKFIAVKMHFGERGSDGYIKPEFVRPILKAIRNKKAKPFLTDTNTIYHGPRNNAVTHLRVAAEHGFSLNRLQAPIIIADGLLGDDYDEIEIGAKHFRRVKIATAIRRADAILALSHFKGHLLAGFGGAIKNLGMGCGARAGKFEMHCSVSPTVQADKCIGCKVCLATCAHGALSLNDGKISLDANLCAGCGDCVIACHMNALSITWNEGTVTVQEKYVEYASGAVKGKRAFYINFLNHITPNCDCMGMEERGLLPDVGILASDDPLAIDQASYDLVLEKGGDVFKKVHPGIDGTVQLSYAEKIGLGSREYELIEV